MIRRSILLQEQEIPKYQKTVEYLLANQPQDIKKIVDILRKPKQLRTEDDVLYLMSQIEHHDFFQKQKSKTGINGDQSLLYSCAKCLGFECFAKGDIICLEGEVSDRFFVVLDGAVNIFLLKDAESLQKEATIRRQKSQSVQRGMNLIANQMREVRRISQLLNSDIDGIQQMNNFEQEQTTNYVIDHELGGLSIKQIANSDILFQDGIFQYRFAVTLKKGAIFGELGLIRNKPRAATVISYENTYFATMSKNDYDNILKEVEQNKVNKKIEFFINNLFEECSRDKIAKICYDFEKVTFNYKQVIYKENDESTHIYLLYKGFIKLTKERTFMEPRKRFLEDKEDVVSFMRSTQRERTLVLQIADLTSGQCFGEDDVLRNRLRTLNAVSMSHSTKVYMISRDKFEQIIQDPQIMKVFTERAYIKDNWRSQQIEMHKQKCKRDEPHIYQIIYENSSTKKTQQNNKNSTSNTNSTNTNNNNNNMSKQSPLRKTHLNSNKKQFSQIRVCSKELLNKFNQQKLFYNNTIYSRSAQSPLKQKLIVSLTQRKKICYDQTYLCNLDNIIKYNQETFKMLNGDQSFVIDFQIKDYNNHKKTFMQKKHNSQRTISQQTQPNTIISNNKNNNNQNSNLYRSTEKKIRFRKFITTPDTIGLYGSSPLLKDTKINTNNSQSNVFITNSFKFNYDDKNSKSWRIPEKKSPLPLPISNVHVFKMKRHQLKKKDSLIQQQALLDKQQHKTSSKIDKHY